MTIESGFDRSIEVESSLFSSILRRRKRVVLAFAAVITLATVALTMRQTRIYAATSAVVVDTPLGQPSSVAPNMATEAQVARSLAVARVVIDELHLHISPRRLVDPLSVHVPVDSDVLEFTYASPQPKVAQTGAQSFAKAYLTLRRNQLKSQILAQSASIEDRIRFLTTRLSALRANIRRERSEDGAILRAQANALTAQIGLLQQKLADVSASTTVSAGATLGPAPLPESPARPRTMLNAAVALFAGLLLGFAVAAAQEYAYDRIRGPKELQARLGVLVLGLIPASGRKRDRTDATGLITIGDPGSFGAEAFRRLRTNFLSAARDAGARSVLVTSAHPREGKTSVAANLAVALAAAGKRVVLVSADLRRPTLEEMFGVTGGVGFVDVLRDSVSLSDALRDSGVENLRLCGGGSRSSVPVVMAGPGAYGRSPVAALARSSGLTPSGPAELIGSDRAARVIEEIARDLADFVLVDAPPLLAVAVRVASFAPRSR